MNKLTDPKDIYYLTPTSSHSGYEGNFILDGRGRKVKLKEFQDLLINGKVKGINSSLAKLIQFNYDFDRLNKFYEDRYKGVSSQRLFNHNLPPREQRHKL